MALALLLTGMAATSAWAQGPPPLSQTTDVLAGKRILLSMDNLVVTGSFLVPDCQDCQPCFQDCLFTPSFYLVTAAPNAFTLFETVNSNAFTGAPFTQDIVPTTTNLGRLFNLPRDVLVRMQASVLQAGQAPLVTVVLQDLTSFSLEPGIPFPGPYSPPSGAANADVNATVLADLNGDGLDDIATNVGAGTLRIGTATDVNDSSAGLTWGPLISTPQFKAIAAGDFDGDGRIDLAAAYFDPDASTGTLAVYSVDPSSLAVTLRGTVAVPAIGPQDQVALTAGRYLNVGADQIALIVNSTPDFQAEIFSYSVDPTFTISPRGFFTFGQLLPIIAGRSGSLDALGSLTAQLVVGAGGTGAAAGDSFFVFTFDDQLNLQQQSLTQTPCVNCLRDLAIGNFTQGVTPTLEIAVLTSTLPSSPAGPAGPLNALIYQVDPTTFAGSLASSFTIPTDVYPSDRVQFIKIAAGDTLGQGLRLGAPSKVTVTGQVQPQVVLGMPPMHVDWAAPSGSTTPTVLNVSAVPNAFLAQYTTTVVNGIQSASTSTTSYTFATSQQEGGGGANSISLFGADLLSFSGTTQSVTGTAYANIVAQQYNTFSTQSFDASTQTGSSDHVWFSSQNFNLFIYPVIGQLACPVDQPGCADADKLPLAVVFSGPDSTVIGNGDGATLEWYQPVHEPFNAMSYPWNQAQLSASFDGFSPLGISEVWFTDSSQQSQFASWSQGSGADVTSGTAQTNSYDKTSSANASILGFGGGETVNYSKSTGFSTVFSNVTTVGESAGMGVIKPGTFLNPPLYEYPVQNFIFGQNDPAGTVQQIAVDTTIQATGALRAGFTADPSGGLGGAGIWWRQTYSVPDVAVNHPARWWFTTETNATTPNCLRFDPGSSASQCLIFNQPDFDDLPASEFHWMRGFFITPASANGGGPQTTYATAGDLLLLQARVYNYSLVDMPPGTTVQVVFYGQRMGSDGTFQGDSFQIGQQALDPIPGFNSPTAGPNPNWSMASTTFDTTPYPDTSLVLWVVVWMQDPDGNLVAELPGHGLLSIPGPLTSMADVPIEPFSNNVGFYNQPIYIAPPADSAPRPGPRSPLAIERVTVAPGVVATFERVKVAATLRAGGVGESGVLVRFFDGDPARGGRMFDAELVPRIRSGDIWTVRVPFRPQTCGMHTLFVVAHGQTGEPVQASTALGVTGTPGQGHDCPVTVAKPFTGEASRIGDGVAAPEVKVSARFGLAPSNGLDLGRARVTISNLLTEAGGAGELVDRVAEGPVELRARPGGRPTSAAFQSEAGSGQPLFTMVAKRRTDGQVEFSLRVFRPVLSQRPVFCSAGGPSTTPLSTRFTIDDGLNPSVEIATEQRWECTGRAPEVGRALRIR